jgi:hypothetical protein
MKPGCFYIEGHFTFVDFASPACNSRPFGFFAAVFRQTEPDQTAFGFFEAHPHDPNLSFSAFVTGVLSRNLRRSFSLSGPNTYQMTSGQTITFTIQMPTDSAWIWGIRSTGEQALDQLGTDISKWPLVTGDALTSKGNTGLITFHNAGTGESLVLDYSDAYEPRRVEN